MSWGAEPMAPWWAGTLTVPDTETTGIDVARDRMVSLAVVRVTRTGAVEPGSLATVVDPGLPIPAGAAAVHGITTERARREGVPPAVALRAAVPLHLHGRDEGAPPRIFNAPFEGPLPAVPLLLDQHFDRYRRGSRRLADVAAHYGVRIDAAHSADAVATAGSRPAGAPSAMVRAGAG